MAIVALHYDPIHRQHDIPRHPEQPERVEAVMEVLRKAGALEPLRKLGLRAATDAELELVHPARHIERIRGLAEMGGGAIDPDTAVAAGSYTAATHAAGGMLAAADAVLGGVASSAFCLARPPGHHATVDRAMGFCLFNNVALAAQYARRQHDVERIAIIDFDVHHGNGTQDIFWEDMNVLYCSVHQYPFYPGSGHWREIGGPMAERATLNVPLEAGCGDTEYLRVFDRLLLPEIERFRPQLLLISAGYDAHDGDPLAGMAVSTAGYRAIAGRLRVAAEALCEGRLIAALEGGYDLADLSASVAASIDVLLAPPPDIEPAPAASAQIEHYLDGLRELHGLD